MYRRGYSNILKMHGHDYIYEGHDLPFKSVMSNRHLWHWQICYLKYTQETKLKKNYSRNTLTQCVLYIHFICLFVRSGSLCSLFLSFPWFQGSFERINCKLRNVRRRLPRFCEISIFPMDIMVLLTSHFLFLGQFDNFIPITITINIKWWRRNRWYCCILLICNLTWSNRMKTRSIILVRSQTCLLYTSPSPRD